MVDSDLAYWLWICMFKCYLDYNIVCKKNLIGFTLHPVYNREGRGKHVLRRFVSHFPPRALRVEWRNSTPGVCLGAGAKK